MSAAPPLLGARTTPEGLEIGLYTTVSERCAARVTGADGVATVQPLTSVGGGFFHCLVRGRGAGDRYELLVGDRALPDPFARWLPDGVHGAASVFASRHAWTARELAPIPPHRRVIYELHVGTFTGAGTYRAAAVRLPELAALGVTTVELMPIAAANGRHGWGYDGVAHFACHAPYGDPDDVRAFIDAAHGAGLEVILDIVYNHFGPSGSYLGAFSPELFRADVTTPWGPAVDYRHPVMRRYLLESARYWLEEVGFDGLRLDATHAIFDDSPTHVLRALSDMVATIAAKKTLFAEDDRNDPRLVTELGLDGIWADDFHHATRVTFTDEDDGYYRGYVGGAAELARTIEGGWLFRGQVYPPSGVPRGHDAPDLAPHHFVYCIQNHDQIGNRAFGERLSESVSPAAYAAASALLLFLPMTPLLFMGQEWGASAPFLYFTDHDAELGRAVTEGRRRELGRFAAFADPAVRETIPDPQAATTFTRSVLTWSELAEAAHAPILSLYRRLLALRASDEVLAAPCTREDLTVRAQGDVLVCERRRGGARRILLVQLAAEGAPVPPTLDLAGASVLVSTRAAPTGPTAHTAAPGSTPGATDELAGWEARFLAIR